MPNNFAVLDSTSDFNHVFGAVIWFTFRKCFVNRTFSGPVIGTVY